MKICPNCGEENPARFRLCGFCGAPLVEELPAQEVRKTVTIVFSDLKGSTAMGEKLDSEAVREVMSRYFDEMRAALERHGGTIEKYIGDAIMAVFGLPRVREDDALRAIRAANEMREHLAALNDELDQRWGVTIGNRTGVNTGEVVAGDPATGQRLVTGDTVNTAARLEQAAPTNEVLLGETTYRLVRHAVEVEEVEPLELKGKAERVPAYRLVSVEEAESIERRHEGLFVGRDREIGMLVDQLREAVAEPSCRLVTLVAQAGVGKSRLIEEFAGRVGADARILRGRCLPYGRGITFWPLVEIVRDAAAVREDDAPAQALEKLAALAGPGADDVVARVASAVGLAEASFGLDEVFWGTRKLLEAEAARQPLVVVLEDIHWAEAAFLDLIVHVATTASDSALLLLATTRPDLFEHRVEWSEQGGEMLELKPLSAEDSALVVEHLLGDAAVPDEVSKRIVAAAEGNPLFVEQLLSMLIDDGLLTREDGRWAAVGDLSDLAIPGTIQALLAARLDLLSLPERAVIEPASVAGLYFARSAVEELVPDPVRPEVEGHLTALSEKQLVRPEATETELDHRFHHILVRDAAYQGILKRARATLHERFVEWAERVNRESGREIEYEEILGYHLEQAHLYLSELGPLDDHGVELGVRGGVMLGSAGGRAFGRGDMPAAANLLRRAVALYPEEDRRRLALLPDLGEAMMEIGEYAWAQIFLDEAVQSAVSLGDTRLEANAVMTRLRARHHVVEDLDAWSREMLHEAERLVPLLEQGEAHAELAKVWRLVGFVHGSVCRWAEQVDALRKALEHAAAVDDGRLQARLTAEFGMGLCYGPTPVPTAIAELERALADDLGDRQSEALLLCSLARLKALNGEFQQARSLIVDAARLRDELGTNVVDPITSLHSSQVELLAGDLAAAEDDLRRDYAKLKTVGERWVLPLVAVLLADVITRFDRYEEAEGLVREARAAADENDVETQALLRSVDAKIRASRGELDEAVRLAREAVDLVRQTDEPMTQAAALVDLAQVARMAGNTDEGRSARAEALALYELKGATAAAARLVAHLEKRSEPVEQAL
jgi:class 3 adenylate cyclase/tetratricopeptide (TPR) repeat protein